MSEHLRNAFITIIILLTSCQQAKQPGYNTIKDSMVDNQIEGSKGLFSFDTTIVLKDIVGSKYKGPDLNDSIAKKVLYKHFMQKGYLTPDNLPDITRAFKLDEHILSVDFASIFKVEINNSGHIDAVITYWLIPPYANGHCWQPHKAIISDSDNGYRVTNEEFIPDKYAIDSIATVNEQTKIFGYEYECANHKTLRNLVVRLTRQ